MKTRRSFYPDSPMLKLIFILLSSSIFNPAFAALSVTDDMGKTITLEKPAQRIISLSPGMTELLFEAGGGKKIKGVVSYSDFPKAAKSIPRVGSYNSVDIEKIVALNPDLIVAWESGNPPLQISKLKELGLTVYISEPRNFDDIPKTLNRLGRLMNTEEIAMKAVTRFNTKLKTLEQRYSKKHTKPISVYIQIWNQPLMTINGKHLISRIVEFCNGQNIFHDVTQLTLSLDIETILEKNPDAIIVTREGELGQQWLSRWRQWDFLTAVKNEKLYTANPDHLVRHTPRILQGIEQVCGFLQPQIKSPLR